MLGISRSIHLPYSLEVGEGIPCLATTNKISIPTLTLATDLTGMLTGRSDEKLLESIVYLGCLHFHHQAEGLGGCDTIWQLWQMLTVRKAMINFLCPTFFFLIHPPPPHHPLISLRIMIV